RAQGILTKSDRQIGWYRYEPVVQKVSRNPSLSAILPRCRRSADSVARRSQAATLRVARPANLVGPGQGELADVEVPGTEAGFRVRGVEPPRAFEGLVEAEPRDLGRLLGDPLPPQSQRLRVVLAELELVGDVQRGVPGQGLLDRLDR